MHQPPRGESIWGTINTCVEIALNVYMIVAVDGQGIEREGIMVRKNAVKDTLSEKAAAMGREDGDWLCFDEGKKDIPMYEVLQRRMQARAKLVEVFSQKSGEGFVDTALKILISVVVGALLLAGLYTLFKDTILPTLTQKITSLFNYQG